jgi:hypothetical protein
MQLQLTHADHGEWTATLLDGTAQIVVVVAGTTDAPHPALAAALQGLIERWADVQRAIETFVRALAPDARVLLVPSNDCASRPATAASIRSSDTRPST